MMGSSRDTDRRGTSTALTRLTAPAFPIVRSRAGPHRITASGGASHSAPTMLLPACPQPPKVGSGTGAAWPQGRTVLLAGQLVIRSWAIEDLGDWAAGGARDGQAIAEAQDHLRVLDTRPRVADLPGVGCFQRLGERRDGHAPECGRQPGALHRLAGAQPVRLVVAERRQHGQLRFFLEPGV